MKLYSTTLLIENIAVPYQVYKEGDRLFFKQVEISRGIIAPIFWVGKTAGRWAPINIPDKIFLKQIQEDRS